MSHTHENVPELQEKYQRELIAAGLLIDTGLPGVYGRSGTFEQVVEAFDKYVSKQGQVLAPEVMRFPPIWAREHYLKTTHIESFPDLIGSIHSFYGKEKEHLELLRKIQESQSWTNDLGATPLMMAPAICYPLYPTAKDTVLDENGRLVDLMGFAFRHEPSNDPARMQTFRMHEFVRMGTPEQALAHRDFWLKKGEEIYQSLGMDAKPVLANDPFFGRGGRAMVVSQREQELKYELVIAITSEEKPTAIASSNYHLDHFSHPFNIKLKNGEVAHTACFGFGLERTTLAMFKKFGFDPKAWPSSVKNLLEI
jgi:seryl-tRNA synthetase